MVSILNENLFGATPLSCPLTRNIRHLQVSLGAGDDLLPQGSSVWTGETAARQEDAIQREGDLRKGPTAAISTCPTAPEFDCP
jgi:hypothetical protein